MVELKTGRFTPAHTGQLGFFAWVDGNLRDPHHYKPTVGLVLCTDRNDSVVRYSLASSTSPLAVAGYTYDRLTALDQSAVPSDADLARVGAAIRTAT